ncbi:UDP-N-acetylmuramoylalanine--D-glutamate ligase [Arboricoccus pini]|uniref:UDP-N-acetylmuramoylalanine--D-glutamate ligase n=1 Tax=Arboricoccus pini TaxID=1963835 RepID=A0A212QA76_9PROT|nr:UDP-N-acetylmuramoyl-L-alanine--D-glutamate ligase [Arboricoccus pini]SNB56256.1 UDP-N-acetylmuramoylalanine--D-glutamate ligase [Arboricoccus pini]
MSASPALAAWQGRPVGVIGLARSGIAVVRALVEAGAQPVAFDDRPSALATAVGLGARQGALADISSLSLLVASPGIPFTHPAPHPVFEAARAAGVEIVGDVELFCRTHETGPIIGVTGTNGKSTTSALIHHLLEEAGLPSLLGGNIGKAVFELSPAPGQPFVLELSSFQLDLISRFRPKVAVWLNLTPDHLDRHGSIEGYLAAKKRIFMNQGEGDIAVVAVDDAISAKLANDRAQSSPRLMRVRVGEPAGDEIFVQAGQINDPTIGYEPVADLAGIPSLRGTHNWQNAAAAYAALRGLGLPPERFVQGFASFKGLPHRMEEVRRFRNLCLVNDSKATNPDSATRSLAAFENIFWIAGGKAKPGGFASLDPYLANVRHGYFIGDAAAEMIAAFQGKIPTTSAGTLERALAAAFDDARSSGLEATILLAPACASFDQFTSYEARGERFRELALDLGTRAEVREIVT